MSQLSYILRVSAVTVEKVALFNQLLHLSWAWTVIVTRTQFDNIVAQGWTWYHDYGDLVFNTYSEFIDYVENCISHKDAYYFAPANSLGPLFALCNLDTEIDLKLNLSSPFQVFVGIVYFIWKLLKRKRCVCPLASSVPSTWDGLILGNFISPSGEIPTNFTPLLRVNFSNPEANPLSTMAASVLNAALAIPA